MSVADTETSVSTRDRILDAAETLFIEHGFAGTSVRAIATEAGVNLAATNYHFGSKKGLFSAVFQRRVQPINEERLQRLSRLQKEVQVGKRKLTVRLVLECFFEPLRHVDPGIPALVGRMHGEPASLTRPILEEAFLEVAGAFHGALRQVLPELSHEELRWRFHFMIGSMIHLLQMHAPLGSESTHDTFTSGVPRLINFVQAGMAHTDNGKVYD